MMNNAICLITFSDNEDHQEVIYSMYQALKAEREVYTFGIVSPKSPVAPHEKNNYYFDCPKRPGITKEAFRLRTLVRMAGIVRKKGIGVLYFESMHLWNLLLMLLCPGVYKVVALHDVFPHDGNRGMDICNYFCCKVANHIVLRNRRYLDAACKRLKLKREKITCIEPWRHWIQETPYEGGKDFLCFGRVRRYKGMPFLKEVISRCPEASFVLAGDVDAETRPIVEEIRAFSNVKVIDREVGHDEMIELFRLCRFAILPYATATQSGVIVDGYKYARPVISFDVGANSEQIDPGKTGYLVPEGNIEEFIKAINDASKLSEKEMAQMCHQAYAFGMKKYSANGAKKSLLAVLCQHA